MSAPRTPVGDGPTIGIVAALWIEGLAMRSLLEQVHDAPQTEGDPNHYQFGTLPSREAERPHRVVLTTMPQDNNRNAAAICTNLIRSFPSVRCVLMVGIAGGVPSPNRPDRHVRLGDIVVATGGIVDYGHIRQVNGVEIPRRPVDGLSQDLRRAAFDLAARNFGGERPWEIWLDTVRTDPKLKGFRRPAENSDLLFVHGQRRDHPPRPASGHTRGKPKVHLGVIGSADVLLRDADRRDQLATEHGIIAFEMEASGIAAGSVSLERQWFMVRGIADYCDDLSKNDNWHAHASMAAAAYVKAVLAACHPFARGKPAEAVSGAGVTTAPMNSARLNQLPIDNDRLADDSPARWQKSAKLTRLWADHLVEILLGSPHWLQLANRRTASSLVRAKVDDFPELADHDPRTHLSELLSACMARPRGLSAFREALIAIPVEHHPTEAIGMIDEAAGRDLIPTGKLRDLRSIIHDSSFAAVDVAELPEWIRPTPNGGSAADTLTGIVDEILGRPAVDDSVPALLGLVREMLSSAPDSEAGLRLQAWEDDLARTLRFPSRGPAPLSGEGHTTMRRMDISGATGRITPQVGTRGSTTDRPGTATQTRPVAPSVWNVPPRNIHFTGREQLLADLHAQLENDDMAAVLPHALHGLGGVGKTQLALEYIYRHQSEFDVVWWIPAEQTQQIFAALVDLAPQLDLEVPQEANTAIQAVKDALRRGHPYDRWLLVFDNAEDTKSVQDNIPTGGPGKILVTSRNIEWTQQAESLAVDVFQREESKELLRRRDKEIVDEDADRLAAALGDLPLAIEQAAAWLTTTGSTVDDYLTLLRDKQSELLALGSDNPVSAVWSLSLERLESINPGAAHLLEVAAFMAPDPIDQKFFASSGADISPELNVVLRNPIKLGRAVRDIQKFALAKVEKRGTIQLHRLVQAVLVNRMSEERRNTFKHGAHVLLASANRGEPTDRENWDRYLALLPHVKVSDAASCPDPWVRGLVLDVIRFLFYWGDHAGCESLADEVFQAWRQSLGEDDPETLGLAKFLGYILFMNGQFRRAKEIWDAAYDGHIRAGYAEDDETLLDAKRMVAVGQALVGEFDKSLAMCREAHDVALRAFEDEDPTTLAMAHDLAVRLRLSGRFADALELDQRTWELRVEEYGPDSRGTLETANGRSIDIRELGDYVAANAEQEKLHRLSREVYGDNHPLTLALVHELAVAKRKAGQHQEALELIEAAEKLIRERYGSASFRTITALLSLASALRQNRDLHSAINAGRAALKDYATALADNHPFAYAAQTNLAVSLRLAGEIAEAHSLSRDAWEGMRNRLGDNHPMSIVCAINLASARYGMGDHAGAFELDSDTMDRSRRLQGENHPTTLACQTNLALDLRALGRLTEADAMHEDVVERFVRALGPEHPASVAAKLNIRADCDIDPMPL